MPLRRKHPTVINTEAATMTRCRPKAFAISVNRKQLATLHNKNRSIISAGSLPVALEKAPGFAAVAKQTQSLTNARKDSINKCAQRDSYNVYFSAAAIGFARRTSGRRRSVASDGRRGGGGGKLVAGRATTRGRGATRAVALGAAALQAKRSRWRGIMTGESYRNDACEALRRHFDQYRCASDAPAALICKPTQHLQEPGAQRGCLRGEPWIGPGDCYILIYKQMGTNADPARGRG